MTIQIKLLADCADQIPTLAELWFQEIGKPWVLNASVEHAINTYKSHLTRDALPLTYVALQEDVAIGMASLRDNDGIREDLTPWLGSVIVHPNFRRRCIGEKLINTVKSKAKNMAFSELYLFALDATIPNWYKHLGWTKIGDDKYNHHPVTVMKIILT